jgi:hypothetical protein
MFSAFVTSCVNFYEHEAGAVKTAVASAALFHDVVHGGEVQLQAAAKRAIQELGELGYQLVRESQFLIFYC